METIIKKANVRVMLSHNYSNFEVAMELENEGGISLTDIGEARKNCQSLANDAVNEYRQQPHLNRKDEIEKVKNKIKEIEKDITQKEPEKVDPKEIERVEALPLYEPKKEITGKSANEILGLPKTKASKMKIPNDISGLGADD